MIKCRDLTLQYRDRVVIKEFSAEIKPGTIAAIVGVNGVGKSTLLAALAGDLAPSRGEISISDRDIQLMDIAELASVRSVALQSHAYWLSYSVREILALGFDGVASDRIDFYANHLGIDKYLEQSITTLSGGQLQRIEIARALIPEVPLLLLDEPFASQDLRAIDSIRTLLLAERDRGRTIVLVAHARGEDLSWCDQIIELTD